MRENGNETEDGLVLSCSIIKKDRSSENEREGEEGAETHR